MSSTGRGSERVALDAYFTPDKVAQAIVDQLHIPDGATILEPSVGGGAFIRALRKLHGHAVRITGSDINPEAPGYPLCDVAERGVDFLSCPDMLRYDYIIGNPPYDNAEAHIRKALSVADNVVFLLRAAMLESRKRRDLWRDHPARHVWMLEQRPSFTGGATDSCMYAAIHWDRNYSGPTTLSRLEAP